MSATNGLSRWCSTSFTTTWGRQGNYLADFGPYFTDRYRTPWGDAVNFDGPYSDDVRSFFIENALYWFESYHIDALRLDAIHGIFDQSAVPFLASLSEAVADYRKESGRTVLLIAESDLNDARVVAPAADGGLGMDGEWSDDFPPCPSRPSHRREERLLRRLRGCRRRGYRGQGRHGATRARIRLTGSAATAIRPQERPAAKMVVFCQNHDQVGNRMRGERLSTLVPFEALKAARAVLLPRPTCPFFSWARSRRREPVPLFRGPCRRGADAGGARRQEERIQRIRLGGRPARPRGSPKCSWRRGSHGRSETREGARPFVRSSAVSWLQEGGALP